MEEDVDFLISLAVGAECCHIKYPSHRKKDLLLLDIPWG